MTLVPRIITPPAAEPISLEDCRTHLRLIADGSPPEHPHDAMILAELSAAREWAENFTGRALVPQTLEVALPAFPSSSIVLPRAPVSAIVSMSYLDDTGALQTLDPATYWLDVYSDPPLVWPAAVLTTWPTASTTTANPVTVRYEAGYSLPGDSPQATPLLPASIRAALLLILGDLYENAEDSNDLKLTHIPRGAEALLRPYRLHTAIG